jgi:hypothetical protein
MADSAVPVYSEKVRVPEYASTYLISMSTIVLCYNVLVISEIVRVNGTAFCIYNAGALSSTPPVNLL